MSLGCGNFACFVSGLLLLVSSHCGFLRLLGNLFTSGLLANSGGGAGGAETEGLSSILSSLRHAFPINTVRSSGSRGNKRCCNVRPAHRSLDLGDESERVPTPYQCSTISLSATGS